MGWDDYARHLLDFINEPTNGILLKAEEQRIQGRCSPNDYCVFELTSGRLQTEFLTLWPLLDQRTERERCLGMFARKAREIRERNPFSVMVTCTATSRIIMENVHEMVESDHDRVKLYYLGDYPYLGAESASPLPFEQQRVLIVTDVIASATLVKDLARYVRERGGTVAAVLCVAVIDPALCAEALANADRIAVLPEKDIPAGHRRVPVHALTWKPIDFLDEDRVNALVAKGHRLRQIKIDARTVSPRIQREPNGQPLARFTVDETYPLLEQVEALDFDFYKAGNRLFTTGVRIGRLLYDDPTTAENLTGDPELDLNTSETGLSRSGVEIWNRIADLFDPQQDAHTASPSSHRVLVTTYNREDLRFRDFVEDGHQRSKWAPPPTILIPRADSIEMPEAYDWLEQHQQRLVDADVILLLASARSSENLWRVASVLASVRVRSISVICLINRMGPTTLDFVQRVRKLLGDLRPIAPSGQFEEQAEKPVLAHEVRFSFYPVLNLPDLEREQLAKMQTAVKTLMDLHCSRTAVEGFRARSDQMRRYFEPSLTTSREFERGGHHLLPTPFIHPSEPHGKDIAAISWEAKMSLLVRYLVYSQDHSPLIREIESVSRYEEMVDLLRIFLSELDFLKISGRFGNLRCALIRRLLRSQMERYAMERDARIQSLEPPREQITGRLQLESWLIFALGLFAYTDQRFDYRAFLQRLMSLDLPVEQFDELECDELQQTLQDPPQHTSYVLADGHPSNLALFYENDGIAWALSVLLQLSTPASTNGSATRGKPEPQPLASATGTTGQPTSYEHQRSLVRTCERFLGRLQSNSAGVHAEYDASSGKLCQRDREVARQNLHLLLKDLRAGASSGPKRRHETIRHLQAQLLNTPKRHHPVESSLQEAIDDIDKRFERLTETLPPGAHAAANRKIRFSDPLFKHRVQDAMHAAAALNEIAESAADLFSFTSVVPIEAERFMNAPGGSPFARDVGRLTRLLQRARTDKAIALAELQMFQELRTKLLEDIFGVTVQLREPRHGRAALEDEDEGLEDIGALLAKGREVGSDGREEGDAGVGAEGAGDLLLEFGHADVAFGEIVVERHPQVGDEAQHLVALLA